MATLYHWDLPQALQDAGGWPARDTAERFADYAASTFAALRDRVSTWATINEPWCSAFLGYATGLHAPGLRDPGLAAAAAHHLLLGHGLAVRAMRAVDTNPRLGIVLNVAPVRPLGGHEGADLIDVTRRVDGLRNRLFLDPLLLGQYPTDVLKDLDPFGGLPIRAEDLATIGQRLDWIGINYYNDIFVKPAQGRTPLGELYPGTTDAGEAAPGPLTDMGWPISPEGLHRLLVTIRDRYPEAPPLMITENGAAYSDPIGSDGTMRDERRIAYLDAHIRAVHRAIVDGVDVRGYLVWTLVDNFEWAEGYAMRFGLAHLDRGTLRRTPRQSAAWYRAVINRNGLLAHLDSHGHDVDLRQRSDG